MKDSIYFLKVFNNTIHLDIFIERQKRFYDFQIKSNVKVMTDKEEFNLNISQKTTFRLKLSVLEKAVNQFRMKLLESEDYNYVLTQKDFFKELETEIIVIGSEVILQDTVITNNRKYVLVSKSFSDKNHLSDFMKKTKYKQITDMEIVCQKKPHIEFELFDSDLKYHIKSSNILMINYLNEADTFYFPNVEYFDESLEKYQSKELWLQKQIIFQSNKLNSVDLINRLPIDLYVEKVILSELGADMPLEFYKSMSLICRCEIFNRIGHLQESENYDFEASTGNLLFKAIKEKEKSIEVAVQSTSNEGIFYGKDICQAFFSISSGGQTEDGNTVLKPYKKLNYSAVSDNYENASIMDLSNEFSLKKFIDNSFPAYSNLESLDELPRQLKISKRYYRWQEMIPISQLQKNLLETLHLDIGTIHDLQVLERSISGNIISIEVIASHKNIKLLNDDSIRTFFGNPLLASSCFYFEKIYDEFGFINLVLIKGAGIGHRVGLCKTGATMMAKKGKNYREIISHYFKNSEIRRIY